MSDGDDGRAVVTIAAVEGAESVGAGGVERLGEGGLGLEEGGGAEVSGVVGDVDGAGGVEDVVDELDEDVDFDGLTGKGRAGRGLDGDDGLSGGVAAIDVLSDGGEGERRVAAASRKGRRDWGINS